MSDIKLFNLNGQTVNEINGAVIELEKSLQTLFERNLDALIGVRFLVSEYSIKDGRIDTLGLDENNCPVIIEYKRQTNESIIVQGLFYLDLLMENQSDFKLLVMEKIGKEAADAIDWSAPRLVCIAGDFKRYDTHAVKQMNRNIELIRYRKFGDDLLMLDLLTATTGTTPTAPSNSSGRSTQKDHEDIIAAASSEQKERYEALVDYLHSLGDDVQERHLQRYVAFKRIKNFACVELRNQRNNIMVFIQINPDDIELIEGFSRDVREIGHYGTGNIEITISSDADLERAKPLIQQSYEAS
ncbi:endonuclease NucS domain-containing protein [Alphaproteobacteria bacterium LSUCC0684]